MSVQEAGRRPKNHWVEFFGRRVLVLLVAALFSGISLFGVELLFAYVLQGFLVALGVSSPQVIVLPEWLNVSTLEVAALWLFGAGLARGLINAAQKYSQHAVVHEFLFLQRRRVIDWALTAQDSASGHVSNLLDGKSQGAALAVQGLLQGLLFGATSCLLGVYLLRISPILTAGLGLAMVILAIPLRWLNKSCDELGRSSAAESQAMMRRLMVGVRNLLFLQIYGVGRREAALATESLSKVRVGDLRFVSLNMLAQLYPNLIGPFVMAAVAIIGKNWLVMDGGDLLAYFYLVFRLFQGLSSLAMSASQLRFYWPYITDLRTWWSGSFKVLYQKHESIGVGAILGEQSEKAIKGLIGFTLESVAFQYPGAKSPLFEGLNLSIRAGSVWVCRGESGAGKSTLLALLLGQLTPSVGSVWIEVGGKKIPMSRAQANLFGSIGYVGPEPFLFDGTIRENLLYALGDDRPTELQIQEALSKSECQFILGLPKGLDHVLTEQGLGLSAGQKQRLGLARALLRKPRVLILDEATANLDFDTERRLIDTLRGFKGQMTILIVTHRPALIELADSQTQLDTMTV